MEGNYYIASSSKIGEDYNAIGEKSKVTETVFFRTLENEVKQITSKQPDRFEETHTMVKDHIETGVSITIGETWFQWKKLTKREIAAKKKVS